ncbi:hypothetical protein DL95DRAFT_470172 [Leptodontidium sp. 2 PMI_412]|nr:hypothetical protein DL95DRAFT_470172 [Leptodontidium sp. 2 PMI_412]
MRRQVNNVLSCVFRYTKIDVEDGGVFDTYVAANKWLDAGFTLAQEAPAVLVKYISLISKEEAAKSIVWLAIFSVAVTIRENIVLSGQDQSLSVAKINIPATGFATKPKDEGCDGSEPVTIDSLLCSDYDCQGEATGYCLMPPHIKCSYFQQQWLTDVFNDLGSDTSGGQQIALTSYTNPLGDAAAWERMISYDSNKLSILVTNVLNGPDYAVDKSWSSDIQKAAKSGKTVIGYVRTGYLGLAYDFKTRLGSGDLASWTSQIKQDVDKW